MIQQVDKSKSHPSIAASIVLEQNLLRIEPCIQILRECFIFSHLVLSEPLLCYFDFNNSSALLIERVVSHQSDHYQKNWWCSVSLRLRTPSFRITLRSSNVDVRFDNRARNFFLTKKVCRYSKSRASDVTSDYRWISRWFKDRNILNRKHFIASLNFTFFWEV